MGNFAAKLQPRMIPNFRLSEANIYDPTSDRSKKNGRDKFMEDRQIMIGTLPDFYFVAITSTQDQFGDIPGTVLGEDEITRSFRPFFENSIITFPLLMAVQYFLDINHIFREAVVRGYLDLHRNGTYIMESLIDNFEFHLNLKPENWTPTKDLDFVVLAERIKTYSKLAFSIHQGFLSISC